MKLYIDYVNKYEGAIQMIEKYKAQNPLFVNFLKVCWYLQLWACCWFFFFLFRKLVRIKKVNGDSLETS